MNSLALALGCVLLSLVLSAPTEKTPTKGIVFPKKIKFYATDNLEEPKNSSLEDSKNPTDFNPLNLTSKGLLEKSILSSYAPLNKDNEFEKDSTNVFAEQQVNNPVTSKTSEEMDNNQDMNISKPEKAPASASANTESANVPLDFPGPDVLPMPAEAPDGLIEYNLGNPLALRMHLPWWPLKDMLKNIQDAISLMNITTGKEALLAADSTKTKMIQFDDRNYMLKVRVLKPSENNRLLVRLISLTPVINEDKLITEQEMKSDGEEKDKTLFEKIKDASPPIEDKKKGDEGKDDDDADNEKEDGPKGKGLKKDGKGKKKKYKQEEESDSD